MCRISPKLCRSLTWLDDIRGLSIVDNFLMLTTGSQSKNDSMKVFWKRNFKCGKILSVLWIPIHFRSSSCVMVMIAGAADLTLSRGRIGGGLWVEGDEEGGSWLSFGIAWGS